MDCKPLLLTAMLLALPAFGGEPDADASRPHCDAKHVGEFWPDAKNNPAAIQDLAQRGDLQVCTRGAWHYNWQRITISIEQLRTEKKKPASSATDSK